MNDPETLCDKVSAEVGKNIRIVSCAFRKYVSPTNGTTGGPGSVLAIQKHLFGDLYRNIPLTYLFSPTAQTFKYPPEFMAKIKDFVPSLQANYCAATYIQCMVNMLKRSSHKTELLFVCHDVGSAYGAFLCGLKYVLIFHSQGCLVHEQRSYNFKLSESDVKLLNSMEEVVFKNAEKVYFPSKGAKDAFVKTTSMNCEVIKFAQVPLYNTIFDPSDTYKGINVLNKLNLHSFNRETTDVFLSIGDFCTNKGQDQIPSFLQEYAKRSKRKIYWIGIGNSINSELYENLKSEQNEWLFDSTLIGKRTDHDSLLALLDLADYYIMFQRYSIFDLATLEAMQAGKGLVMSNIGGNIDVNKENNVVLVDSDNITAAVNEVLSRSKKEFGEQNKNVFYKYFSPDSFFKAYTEMLDNLLA